MKKNIHKTFMNRAIKLSIANVKSNTGGPFGAVIVKDNQIIAEGVNLVTAINDPTAHAEINAIRTACLSLKSFQLDGCIIYSSCEPCPMCLGAIYWAHLAEIYFANTKAAAAAIGFDDSFIYNQLKQPLTKRDIPTHHQKVDEAEKAFSLWKKNAHKILY